MFVPFENVRIGTFQEKNQDPDILSSTADIVKHLECLAQKGTDSICFIGTGSDPVLRKDIFEILDFANQKGFQRIKINTSARYFKDKKHIFEFFKRGAFFFEVPLFAHTPSLHDKHTGEMGSFRQAINGLKLIRKNPIHRRMNYRAFLQISLDTNKINYQYLAETISFCFTFNPDRIRINLRIPEISLSKIIPDLKNSLECCIENNCFPIVKGIPPCLMQNYEYFLYDFYNKCSGIPGNQYLDQCQTCLYFRICPGIPSEYIEKYGTKEFSPVLETTLDMSCINYLLKNPDP